jgi:carbamoylphosphate synthase large subunit
MNVQFAVKDGEVYILEVNPRASRTVPFVAKATGVPIAKIAARVMAGEKLAGFARATGRASSHVAVKEAVFPFARFPGVDVILGPEMKSTGEVMGLDRDFGRAFAKSQLGAAARTCRKRAASSSASRTATRRRSSRRCSGWRAWASASWPHAGRPVSCAAPALPWTRSTRSSKAGRTSSTR